MIVQSVGADLEITTGTFPVIIFRKIPEVIRQEVKIIVGKVPIIISRAAPTDQAIELAQKIGVTLVGFARKERMNIYTHPERIEV